MKYPFKSSVWSICLALVLSLATVACSDDDAEAVAPETPEEQPETPKPPTTPEEPKAPEVVTIADTRLATQVRLALGLTADAEINKENILKLDTLNLDAEKEMTGDALSGISNLAGLEAATNLTYIHLGYTSVTDLTPLKDLKKVAYLRINNTEVTSLAPVAAYTTLTYFNANTVRGITDISPLAGNTGMKEIILREVPFGDAGMQTIAKFTVLYRINMRSTGVTDITALGQLMQAGALLNTTPGAQAAGGADLDLRGLDVKDWSPITPYLGQIAKIEGLPK